MKGIEMNAREWEKRAARSIDYYSRMIDNLIGNFMANEKKFNPLLAIPGFLLVVLGLLPIMVMEIDVLNYLASWTPLSVLGCFFLFIVSFIGYMLIHRSTEKDWL